MKKTGFLIILIFLLPRVFCQTSLPSVISVNTTLTKSNSPYLVQSNITVNSGITLKIEAGVVVLFGSQATITINGQLIAEGTKDDSIHFYPETSGVDWGYIAVNHANIQLSYISTRDNKMFIFGTGKDLIKISHCNIVSTASGNGEDCIGIHDTKKIVVEYISLKGAGGKISEGIKNDAIDLDNCDSCFISYSHIFNFSDDGIDIGTNTKYAYIHDNILSHCNYGATVGESSKAYFINNISSFNDGGLEVHTGSTVYCENNILYANTIGIDCYHREQDTVQTGGNVYVKNTIFYQSVDQDIVTQSSSFASVSYSISDIDTLDGTNNLTGNPLFSNAENDDFSLLTGSPCINTGIDSSGNSINMGVINFQISQALKNFTVPDKSTFKIYPNPAGNYVVIELNSCLSKNKFRAIIYDTNGKSIININLLEINNYLNIQNLPRGAYFIEILNNEISTKAIKFIKS